LAVAAAVLTLASSTACAKGRTSASPPTTIGHAASDEKQLDKHKPKLDPCTLVTRAEAEVVLGPVGLPREGTDPILGTTEDQRVCVFSLERDPKVGANVGVADFEASTKFDSFHGLFSDRVEEISGLGEHAAWLAEFRVLLVLDHPELVSVQMTEVQEQDKALLRKKAIELATVALARLRQIGARG